jgi:hypothetical protein
MTWRETVERYLAEGRTVSGGKGGHSAQEQSNADAVRQQQFNLMQQQLQSVNSILNPMIANGGMMPAQQQALTAIALNDIPQQFKGVAGNINDQLVSRGITGGDMAGSGDIARNFAGLGAMEAGLQQNALSNIQLQKQQQLMNALGIKGGMLGMFNQGGLSALNSGVTAANNADQAATSWMGPVFGALGSIGGAAMKIPCWVARAVYGDDAPQVNTIYHKLYRDAERSYVHRAVLGLYIIFGEPIANLVKRSALLKRFFRRILDAYAR